MRSLRKCKSWRWGGFKILTILIAVVSRMKQLLLTTIQIKSLLPVLKFYVHSGHYNTFARKHSRIGTLSYLLVKHETKTNKRIIFILSNCSQWFEVASCLTLGLICNCYWKAVKEHNKQVRLHLFRAVILLFCID